MDYILLINVNDLFKILAISSPTNLFRFKFINWPIGKDSLNRFFDNWKGRCPILIQSSPYIDIMESYKEEGTIKHYSHLHGEDFEWES